MGRSLPKIVVLVAIVILVAAIYVVERRMASAPEPGVVYVNPSIDRPAPAPPAP